MRVLRAQSGVGPTGKEVRENERLQRKVEKEQRLLEKFAKRQARRTGMSETEVLLEVLNDPEQFGIPAVQEEVEEYFGKEPSKGVITGNPEQFEAFKERRQILGGLAGMAGLGLLGAAIPAVSRMRRRLPGGFTPVGAQTQQTNILERLFPGLFGIDG